MIYGDGINGGNRNNFSVSLQFSTNNGDSWSTLGTYSLPTQWTRFRVNLPLAAQSPNTLIRWIQDDGDGFRDFLDPGTHIWALDNISIVPGPLDPPRSLDGSKKFDDGFWSDISNASISNAFAGNTQSIFFGGNGFRFAETISINTEIFQSLGFDLIYGDGDNGGPVNNFGVSLQYSTDNKASWVELEAYSYPIRWTRFQVNLPLAAQAPNTFLRWIQDDGDGRLDFLDPGSHAWALDNIIIKEQPVMNPYFVDFSNAFNDGLWGDISNASITNTFAGRSQSLFFGGRGFRYAEAVPINILNFNSLSFDIVYGDGLNGGTRNSFNVSLQYSTNSGASWVTLRTYGMQSQWSTYTVDMPLAAQTDKTLIRWIQDDGDGRLDFLDPGTHVWALDNIRFNLSFSPGLTTSKGVNLGFTSQGDYALKTGTNFPIPVTFGGKFASASKPGSGWSAVVASPSGREYKLIWKNVNSYARWILDDTGALTRSSILSEAEVVREEYDANFDINGDGRIGIEYAPGSTTVGNVNLGSNSLGYAIKNGTNAPVQITFSDKNARNDYPGSGWSPVAAAGSESTFKLYWKNSFSGRFSRWILDDSGTASSTSFLSNAEVFTEESAINHDLNGDGKIGLTYSPGVATIGTINLGQNQLGYAIKKGASTPTQITFAGQFAGADNPGNGWSSVAAAAGSGSGFKLYWKNSTSGRFSRWLLDDAGGLASSSFLNDAEIFTEESAINHDLNGDGKIGLTYSPGVATIGIVNLGSNPLGYAIKRGASPEAQITFAGQIASANNPGSGWLAVAASAGSGDGFDLYWLNSASNQMAKWELNPVGSLVSGAVMSKRNVYETESRLGYDLNRDGITGLPFSSFANIRGTGLGNSPTGYAIKNGTNNPIPITTGNQDVSPDFPGGGWRAIAAQSTTEPGVGYQLYWFNRDNRQYAKWSLNSSGASIGSTLLSTPDVLAAEIATSFDLSSNGIIGTI